ncbi:MAG: hypothetical protein ABJE95_08335 [Byssovorax sp.]
MNESPPPPLVLAPVALPGAPLVRMLRLVAVDAAPVLLASTTYSATPPLRTEIQALPLAGSGPSGLVATVGQLLPVPPRWDAAVGAGGKLSFVVELAGGALNALFQTDGTTDHRSSLTAHHPFGSFSAPRFVRDAGAAQPAVTAVLDDATAVLLDHATPPEHPIAACNDLVITTGSSGATAVCKRYAPGASRGGALPGSASVFALDPAHRAAGAEIAPFGERRIFELDADASGGDLVIVATAGAHLLLAHRKAEGAAFQTLQVDPGGASPQAFSSPCVVITGRTVTLAVLSRALTPDARVLVATWPLDALP